mgnify:FL=1
MEEQEFTEAEVVSTEVTTRPITIGEQQIGIKFTDDDNVFGNIFLKQCANLVNHTWEIWAREGERLSNIKDNPNKLPLSVVDQKRTDYSMVVTNIVTAARHFKAALQEWT